MQQLIVVLFVLLSLWGVVWFLKRKGIAIGGASLIPKRRNSAIESLDRMRLSPQHSLHLIRVDGRKLLVGVHPGGLSILGEGDPAHPRQDVEREFTTHLSGNQTRIPIERTKAFT